MSTHRLSVFQRDEVSHLLAVAQEALDNDETTERPWGVLDGRSLTVTDWRGARRDLADRADWLLSEGSEHGGNGSAGARSLTRLADEVYAMRDDA